MRTLRYILCTPRYKHKSNQIKHLVSTKVNYNFWPRRARLVPSGRASMFLRKLSGRNIEVFP